jgi:hypothetical protein
MLLNEIIKDKHLVFDIGANIGNKTMSYLTYGVRVVCVEPQIDCLIELHRRFKTDRVVIVPYAVSSDGQTRKFRIANANTISTFSEEFINETGKDRFRGYIWGNPTDIETVTLDSLIEKYGVPDYCKIDVEGSEIEVLSGLSQPIPCISYEYTPELHTNALKCLNKIDSLGKYTFNYSEGESLLFSNNQWLKKDDINSYLVTNIKNINFGDIYARIES